MESKTEPSKTKGEFTRKLTRYSAVTVGGVAGTMAVFESSEAAMIVTSTLITLTDDPVTVPTADINLNGVNGPGFLLDGTPDVKVTVATASILSAQGLNGALLAGNIGVAGIGGGTFFYPTAFQAPSTIGPALGFGGGTAATQTFSTFGTLANSLGGTQGLGPGAGNWVGGADAYLGIKFQINGNDHFGWVHVIWDPTTDTAIIDQYAYNGLPDDPAIVPEPSTLALLAIGAVGLAARRRRKETD